MGPGLGTAVTQLAAQVSCGAWGQKLTWGAPAQSWGGSRDRGRRRHREGRLHGLTRRGPCRTHAGAARRPARGPAAPWQEARVEESSRSTRGRPLHAEPLVAWWPFPTRLQPEPETPEPRPGAFLKRLPLNFPCRRQTQEPAQESGVCVPRRPGAGLAAPRRGDSNLSPLCSLSQASDPGDFLRAQRLSAR